jgi:hypothetical protein
VYEGLDVATGEYGFECMRVWTRSRVSTDAERTSSGAVPLNFVTHLTILSNFKQYFLWSSDIWRN